MEIDGFKENKMRAIKARRQQIDWSIMGLGTDWSFLGADILDDTNDALSPADPDPPLTDNCQNEWAVSVLSELQVSNVSSIYHWSQNFYYFVLKHFQFLLLFPFVINSKLSPLNNSSIKM